MTRECSLFMKMKTMDKEHHNRRRKLSEQYFRVPETADPAPSRQKTNAVPDLPMNRKDYPKFL